MLVTTDASRTAEDDMSGDGERHCTEEHLAVASLITGFKSGQSPSSQLTMNQYLEHLEVVNQPMALCSTPEQHYDMLFYTFRCH